jgi:hypothetical protein
MAVEGDGAPFIADIDGIEGPILADQDVPMVMPDQEQLPLALNDHAPPAAAVQDVIPDGIIPQEPSELQRSIRESFRRPPTASVLHMSVKAALRDHPDTAKTAVYSELKQMLTMKVWTPVHKRNLSPQQIKDIIRSSMFCSKKFLPSGVFEKMKARFVAGGHMQDKTLYPNLSSPTVSTPVVYLVAAIAAKEKRIVCTVDITCAYLHVDMKSDPVTYMYISKILFEMLLELDESYIIYKCADGGCIVRLDKALYGTVQAANLWGDNMKGTLVDDGYIINKYEVCCYNKMFSDNIELTTVIHADDLLISSVSQTHIDSLLLLLKTKYKDIKVHTGEILGYLGLVLDFSSAGAVSITAPGFTTDLLSKCRESGRMVTPATDHLFEVRDPAVATIVSSEDRQYFHSEVAKLLYLGKRTHPEILTAIAFLATRINVVDKDDMSKLARVHGYIRTVKDRGIRLHIGDGPLVVRLYADVSFNVHRDGKSHTGCNVIIGDGGSIYFRSAKQKIVVKSSTEGELVGASDSANVGLHIANFLRDQGYNVPPVILYQDNKSAIALFNRGYSTSDLTKHIALRYFWIKERMMNKEMIIEYCPTAKMIANVLTKPLGGRQFISERNALTGWI